MGNIKPYAILLKAVKMGGKNFGELLVIHQIPQSFLLATFLPYGVHLIWRYSRNSPNHQIKATAKYTTYMVYYYFVAIRFL